MTAARHFDRFAAVPGHDEIAAMAPAAIYSCLTRDDDTAVAIGDELAAMGATPQEVAATFAVLAAAMLGEACGGRAEARRLAAGGRGRLQSARPVRSPTGTLRWPASRQARREQTRLSRARFGMS